MKKLARLVLTTCLLVAIIGNINIEVYANQNQKQSDITFTETKGEVSFLLKILIERQNYSSLEEVKEQMDFSMDMNKPCGLSKEDFVELMEELPYDYTGFYARNAEFIWEMEKEYQVNAIFYCGIVAIESGWGKHDGGCNNYTGMMCSSGGLIYYESEEAGIEATFENLGKNYIPKGKTTLSSIGKTYAGDSEWANKVYSAMKMIVSD